MNNEIERFEKLQRDIGSSAASVVTMLRKVESYFPSLRQSSEDERRNSSQNSLDDVERHHAQEEYCAWLRECERDALSDWHEGGREELKRMEAK